MKVDYGNQGIGKITLSFLMEQAQELNKEKRHNSIKPNIDN